MSDINEIKETMEMEMEMMVEWEEDHDVFIDDITDYLPLFTITFDGCNITFKKLLELYSNLMGPNIDWKDDGALEKLHTVTVQYGHQTEDYSLYRYA